MIVTTSFLIWRSCQFLLQTAKDPGDPHIHQIRSVTGKQYDLIYDTYYVSHIKSCVLCIYNAILSSSNFTYFRSQVGAEDAGSYHCVAENVLGQAEVKFC